MEKFQLDLYEIFEKTSKIEVPSYDGITMNYYLFIIPLVFFLLMGLLSFYIRYFTIDDYEMSCFLESHKEKIKKVRKERIITKKWLETNYKLNDTDSIVVHSIFTNVINYIKMPFYYVSYMFKKISILAEFFLFIAFLIFFAMIITSLVIMDNKSTYENEYKEKVLYTELEELFNEYKDDFKPLEIKVNDISEYDDEIEIKVKDSDGSNHWIDFKGKVFVSDKYKEVTLVKNEIPIPKEIYEEVYFPKDLYKKFVNEHLYIPKNKVSLLENQTEILD